MKKENTLLGDTYPIYSPFRFVVVNFHLMNFFLSPEILQKSNSTFFRLSWEKLPTFKHFMSQFLDKCHKTKVLSAIPKCYIS